MKERLLNVAIGVLTLTSLTLTGLLIRRELLPKQQSELHFVTDKNWRMYSRDGVSSGETSSPVTLIIFSDYQCPFCKALDPAVSALKRKYHGSLHVVFHHFPLSGIHPYARGAALAAECANSRGKFAELDSVLFLHQEKLGSVSWGWFGMQAGISDTAWLNRCVADSGFVKRVDSDKQLGDLVPVAGTPTIFINELRVDGNLGFAALDSLIAEKLARS
jgi:protein-disulfide isomerase